MICLVSAGLAFRRDFHSLGLSTTRTQQVTLNSYALPLRTPLPHPHRSSVYVHSFLDLFRYYPLVSSPVRTQLTPGAAAMEADVDAVIQALRLFGNCHSIAGMQALRAEQYRKSSANDLKFMQEDDLEGAQYVKEMREGMESNMPTAYSN